MGITFSLAMLNTLLGYVGDLWTDIKLPVLVIVGIMVGFFIITGIMDAISGGGWVFRPHKTPPDEEISEEDE
jgi:hypothetical protein